MLNTQHAVSDCFIPFLVFELDTAGHILRVGFGINSQGSSV